MSCITYSTKQSSYTIKQNDSLVFKYEVFLYPPFSDYLFENKSENVKVNTITKQDFFSQEGSRTSAETTFTYEKAGTYNITVVKQSQYIPDITYYVTVIVE